MLITQQLKIENLYATKYVFEKKGDVLPKHTHTKETEHITIVLRGSLLCKYKSHYRTLEQGDVYDHQIYEQTHELEALEDNTLILNIIKNGTTDIPDKERTPEELEQIEINRKKFEEEQQIFRDNQLRIIKENEELDRKRGINV